jgi:hypothetical protein
MTGMANGFTGTFETFHESFQLILGLLSNYCFLSFSALNPFQAAVYAVPLCYVTQVDPVNVPA